MPMSEGKKEEGIKLTCCATILKQESCCVLFFLLLICPCDTNSAYVTNNTVQGNDGGLGRGGGIAVYNSGTLIVGE